MLLRVLPGVRCEGAGTWTQSLPQLRPCLQPLAASLCTLVCTGNLHTYHLQHFVIYDKEYDQNKARYRQALVSNLASWCNANCREPTSFKPIRARTALGSDSACICCISLGHLLPYVTFNASTTEVRGMLGQDGANSPLRFPWFFIFALPHRSICHCPGSLQYTQSATSHNELFFPTVGDVFRNVPSRPPRDGTRWQFAQGKF